jgi:ketosteroid isomerase-like protein
MCDENIEAIRAVYGRWSEGDFDASVGLFDPGVVLVLRRDFPEAGTFVGAEAIAAYTRRLLEAWTRLTIEADEIIAAGDSVLAEVVQSGAGSASGAATEFRYFQLWTFRGGKVIRIESIRERAEALAAAGLNE